MRDTTTKPYSPLQLVPFLNFETTPHLLVKLLLTSTCIGLLVIAVKNTFRVWNFNFIYVFTVKEKEALDGDDRDTEAST